mmetsp:Transcript_81109/g.208813  ORF Transcript_81109/g.208813 Transcript_81109/m.208813 type:complete len:208 (+) Transcript_81109:218-841(+)
MYQGSTSTAMHATAPRRQMSQSSGSSASSFFSLSLKSGYMRTSSSRTTTAGSWSLATFSQMRWWLMKQPSMPFVHRYRAATVHLSLISSSDIALPSVAGNRSASTPSRANSVWQLVHRCGDLSRFTTQTGVSVCFWSSAAWLACVVAATGTRRTRGGTSLIGARRRPRALESAHVTVMRHATTAAPATPPLLPGPCSGGRQRSANVL